MEEIQAIHEAAQILSAASRVLIDTGAGMSADSGISTYRDQQGRWRDFLPFTRLGLQPKDFSNPPGYREQPHYAWAFAEYLRRQMANAQPHTGYKIISNWVSNAGKEMFVLTTNIDGLHRRSGVPDSRLYERYGNLWELQCLEKCTSHWWPDNRTKLCHLDEATMRASDLPTCPFCGGLARPRVQMDYDDQFIEKEVGWRFYQNFLDAAAIDVVVIIGTTLWMSWPDNEKKPQVIHINPDPQTHVHYEQPIAITMGAEDALMGIDWCWKRNNAKSETK